MPIADLTTLVNATSQNLSQLKGLSIAYNLIGGAPSIAGYTSLINTNNSTNFGSKTATSAGPVFNDENVYINTLNALYQGNAAAKTAFDAIVNSGATLSDKLTLVYNNLIPAAARTDAGLAAFKAQSAFYEARAIELKVAGANGAALVAYAGLAKIAVDNDIGGLGDTVNDLVAAVKNGTAVLPEDGAVFTPLETADGTQFDADDAPVVQPNAGKTFTLTTNVDGPNAISPAIDTKGTDGNDTYIGSNTTLTSADVIDGSNGIDTVTFRDTSGAGATVAPTLSNVEIVSVTGLTGGATTTVNLVSAPGVTKLASEGSSDAVAFTNVGKIVDLEVSKTSAAAASVNVGYNASVVTGSKDVQNVALNDATAGTITVNGVETTNVTSTGSNTIAGLVTGAATVNLLGAGSASIGGTLTGATTIDGSKATGALSFAIDGAQNVKATGGTADDTITVTGLTSQDDIDAGAGNDFAAFANADVPTTKVTNLKNFEGVQLNAVGAGTVAVNVDNFSGSTINQFKIGTGADNTDGMTAGSNVNITNGTTGSTISLFADDTGPTAGALTFALKTDGAADVLNLNLVNVALAAGGGASTQGLTSLTANGVETLNIDASNKVKAGTTYDTDTLAIATLSAKDATALNIKGTSAISLGTTASTLTALTMVDASAMTTNVTLGTVGGAAFSTANTGAVIKTGTGTDSVSLSVGVTGVLKAVDLGSQSATSPGDTLALKDGGALTGVTVVDLTSATDQITQLLGSANADAQVGIENINLSGLTGSAQITGSSGANVIVGTALNDTINGGGGNDTITGGGGADSITGGAGNDSFIINSRAETQSAAFTAADTTNANIDKILDFAGGGAAAGDGFVLSGAANVFGAALDFSAATVANVTAVTVATAADFTTLAAAVQAASAGVASTNATAQIYSVTVSAGNLAGNYMIVNDNTAAIAATDTFVSVTGISADGLNAADFTFTA